MKLTQLQITIYKTTVSSKSGDYNLEVQMVLIHVAEKKK